MIPSAAVDNASILPEDPRPAAGHDHLHSPRLQCGFVARYCIQSHLFLKYSSRVFYAVKVYFVAVLDSLLTRSFMDSISLRKTTYAAWPAHM